MQNNESSSLVMETISTVNRDSGLSNNIMAYRLALMIKKHPDEVQSTTTLDTSKRENLQEDLRTALSKNTQNVEDYRQNLKDKYYTEYLNKFGVAQQRSDAVPQQDNSTRVENLIAEKKQTFLQKMFEAGKHELPLGRKSSSPDKVPEIIQPENTDSSVVDEAAKKSLIPALMRTVMTMGKDTNQGRTYEGLVYKLQLWIKEGMQSLSVSRKGGNPQIAFTAHKDGDEQEFQITQNNLSEEETNRLITFDKQQTAQQPKTQDNSINKNDSAELGE
ncbi:hypothetical protein [Halotia branconii]|uniref:Uncharacterized protein n=1 Tax=Halotia branconii CENA392 TaxID=1539056 RepID=A0AAJ6PCN9_9CYAN|nr:hypothetical protein [Halotia branconii]WGV29081.1 hypothetical protein QI031_31470 [Halotia branconii CENA392]